MKFRKEQGALAEVTMGYRSIVVLDLVVALYDPLLRPLLVWAVTGPTSS